MILATKVLILSAGGFPFEGMSDDEEEFQSVRHNISSSFYGINKQLRCLIFTQLTVLIYNRGIAVGHP